MLYQDLNKLSDGEFKRGCGVSRKVFNEMVLSVRSSVAKRKTLRGNMSKFTIEDKILIMLQYYREYRTMFHISVDLGVAESTVCRIIDKVEEILIKDKLFQLPPKKDLSQMQIEVIVVDATEIPIQRPKKTKLKS